MKYLAIFLNFVESLDPFFKWVTVNPIIAIL